MCSIFGTGISNFIGEAKILINIDECSMDWSKEIPYSWVEKGTTPFLRLPPYLPKLNIIAAITTSGKAYMSFYRATTTDLVFLNFVLSLC